MVKRLFLITTSRDLDGGIIYGLVMGEDLTKDILQAIWDEAYPIHCRISREYHAAGRKGNYLYDWEVFMTMAFDRGYEVYRFEEPVTGAPEIPILEEFSVG